MEFLCVVMNQGGLCNQDTHSKTQQGHSLKSHQGTGRAERPAGKHEPEFEGSFVPHGHTGPLAVGPHTKEIQEVETSNI